MLDKSKYNYPLVMDFACTFEKSSFGIAFTYEYPSMFNVHINKITFLLFGLSIKFTWVRFPIVKPEFEHEVKQHAADLINRLEKASESLNDQKDKSSTDIN